MKTSLFIAIVLLAGGSAGIIHGDLIKKGWVIEPVDCMIAGIAKVYNKPVLTRDEHFSRIEGLKVEKY